MGKGRRNFSEEKFLLPFPNLFPLNFRNDRNHNRIASYDLAEEAPQGGTDAIAKARDAEPRRSFEMIEDKTLGILKQMAELLLKHKALGNHVRAVDDLAGLLVKHQYNDDNAVAAEKLTLAQNEIAHIAHALAVHKNGIGGDLRPQAEWYQAAGSTARHRRG